MNGMAMAADWMSAASFISMASFFQHGLAAACFSCGMDGWLRSVGHAWRPTCASSGNSWCLSSSATLLLKVTSTVAVLCLLTVSITYIIGQMTGVGVAFPASWGQ